MFKVSCVKCVLALTLILFIVSAGSVQARTEGVRVSTPDTCWFQGNFINLPVQIEWTTWSKYKSYDNLAEYCAPAPADQCTYSGNKTRYCGQGDTDICSFEMELSFNKYKMQAVTVTGADLIDDWHWPDLYFEIDNSAGRIKIAGASADCKSLTGITDAASLFYIGFHIMGRAGDDVDLKVVSFQYNEVDGQYVYWGNNEVSGCDDAKSIGDLMVCEHLCVDGKITYCSNDVPIVGADVTLTYKPDIDVVTPPQIRDTTVPTNGDGLCGFDCRGSYAICNIVGGYDYCLSAWKDDDYDNAITAFDASLVLRYVVNQVDFNCCQEVAADVSGDCSVSAYDASLIMKHILHDSQAYPYFPKNAADLTNWIFFRECDYLCPSENICFTPLTQSRYNQDFKAVILGDVSGNWGLRAKVLPNAINRALNFEVLALTGDKVTLGISLKNNPAVHSGELTIEYPYGLEFVSASPQANNHDWQVMASAENGRVKIAAAGITSSPDALIELTFNRLTEAGNINEIKLSNVRLDEYGVPGTLPLIDHAVKPLPTISYLNNNYPNPFNPSTSIAFGLTTEADVRLDIYNLLGQRVRCLVSGMYPAGHHSIVWDGRNESGSTVASGIYFYRISSEVLTECRKMVMLK